MNVIEALVTTLTMDVSGYEAGVNRAKKAEKALNDELAKTKKQTQENTKEQDKASKSLEEGSKKVGQFKQALKDLGAIYGSIRIFREIVADVSQAEASLYRLSGRINTSAQDLQAWGNAAEIMGGNADEARAGLQALSSDLTALRYKGEMSSRLMFLSQMGVSATDSHGKLKSLTDIQQEIGNRFEQMNKSGRMDKDQFMNLASQAGFDESSLLLITANREEREKILAMQKEYNRLSQQSAEDSRHLVMGWQEFKLLLFTLRSNVFHFFVPFLQFLVDGAVKFMHLINMFPKVSGAFFGFGLAALPLFHMLRLLIALGGGGGATLFRLGISLLQLAEIVGATTSAIARFITPLTRTIGLMMRWRAVLSLLKSPIMWLIAVVAWLIKDLRDFGRNGESIVPWAKIFDGIHDVIEWLGNLSDKITEVWDKLKNHDWSGAWQSLKDIFSGGSSDGGAVGDGGMPTNEAMQAAEYASNHAASKSLKKCAEYVNNAYQALGFQASGNGVDVARNLISQNKGKFQQVAYSKDYVPQIGDVMSMPSSSTSKHNYGHVAIYTKDGWVSDFKQGNKYGNTGAPNASYYSDIQSGRITPTIARMVNPNSGATVASGSLATNQQQAYQAARANGLSDTAARALVANMSGEALHKPSDVHWDGKHNAHGIVQWDDMRANRIKAQFGKMPQNMSVTEQTKAAIWEIQKYYPTTWKALQSSGNAESMIATLVNDYERPANTGRAIGQRVSHLRGMRVTNPMTQPVRPVTNQRLYAQSNRSNSNLVANNANPHNEVSIGQVVIHTQATDAHGIARSIPSALNNSMAGLAFNMDMGQA